MILTDGRFGRMKPVQGTDLNTPPDGQRLIPLLSSLEKKQYLILKITEIINTKHLVHFQKQFQKVASLHMTG